MYENASTNKEKSGTAAMDLKAFVAFSGADNAMTAVCYGVDSTMLEHGLAGGRADPKNAALQ